MAEGFTRGTADEIENVSDETKTDLEEAQSVIGDLDPLSQEVATAVMVLTVASTMVEEMMT
ncbi:hypothetical protein C7293_17090 [filamentous cyanobacterium CCT1]|nr:hypothetical protein C7293_17090 [filamentous cyanobacterium CCT1]PSN79874.1 hypothetical protein C8B47_09400 [filamentous cyanobacterium CCP4]